jgi:outer membrane immunogenic protein
MRKYFTAFAFLAAIGTAQAGDFNGGYIGAHVGGAWGDVQVRDNPNDGVNPGPFNYDLDASFIGGATAGYNWTYQSFLIGIEGDLGYIDPKARDASRPQRLHRIIRR